MNEEKDIVKANLEILQSITGELTANEIEPTPEFILAIYDNVCKDRRMIWIQNQRDQAKERAKNEPATEKQRAFMKKLGIEYEDTISKSEASKLIDEKFNRR